MRALSWLWIIALISCGADATPVEVWELHEAPAAAPEAPGPDREVEPDEPAPTTADRRDHPAAIAGVWLIDQPYHALYEATWYRFGEDGTLDELESETYGHEVPTGTVGRCDEWSPQDDDHCAEFTNGGECLEHYPPYCTVWSDVSCAFADQWWSRATGELSVRASCTDGSARTVVFDVTDLLAGDAEAPRVSSVDGEDGWYHNMWDWRWVKCPAGAGAEECRTFR